MAGFQLTAQEKIGKRGRRACNGIVANRNVCLGEAAFQDAAASDRISQHLDIRCRLLQYSIANEVELTFHISAWQKQATRHVHHGEQDARVERGAQRAAAEALKAS